MKDNGEYFKAQCFDYIEHSIHGGKGSKSFEDLRIGFDINTKNKYNRKGVYKIPNLSIFIKSYITVFIIAFISLVFIVNVSGFKVSLGSFLIAFVSGFIAGHIDAVIKRKLSKT